ncbi:hypothetical protein D3C87_364610 [compost metagenome]|jgi:hypothetical protein
MLMRNSQYTREECAAIRSMLLNDINRKVSSQLKIDKAFLSQFGRCYYIVKIHSPDRIEVTVVAAEAALGEKRSVLQNKHLYAQRSYFGRINYDGKACRFHRETKIKESTTFAEGRKLLTFWLDVGILPQRHSRENIKAAFQYYRGK